MQSLSSSAFLLAKYCLNQKPHRFCLKSGLLTKQACLDSVEMWLISFHIFVYEKQRRILNRARTKSQQTNCDCCEYHEIQPESAWYDELLIFRPNDSCCCMNQSVIKFNQLPTACGWFNSIATANKWSSI